MASNVVADVSLATALAWPCGVVLVDALVGVRGDRHLEMTGTIDQIAAGERFGVRGRAAVGRQSAAEGQGRVHDGHAGGQILDDELLGPVAGHGAVALVDRAPGHREVAGGIGPVDRQALDDQVGVGGQVDGEGAVVVRPAAGHRDRIAAADGILVHLLVGVRLHDDVIVAADAVGQRDGLRRGVARPHGQDARMAEDPVAVAQGNVVAVAVGRVEREDGPIAPVGDVGRRLALVGDRPANGDRLAALDVAAAGQRDTRDFQIRQLLPGCWWARSGRS